MGSTLVAPKFQSDLMSRNEASVYLGVPSGTLAVWASTKRVDLPYIKIGGCVRYRKRDLDAFLEGLPVNGLKDSSSSKQNRIPEAVS